MCTFDQLAYIYLCLQGLRDSVGYYHPMSTNETFAFRLDRYKGNFVTSGQGSLFSNNNEHPDCRTMVATRHQPPLIYDLSQDPGELIQLDQEGNKEVFEKVQQLKQDMDSSMTWPESELLKPSGDEYQQCCTSKCEPFPTCCQCSGDVTPAKPKVNQKHGVSHRLYYWFWNIHYI